MKDSGHTTERQIKGEKSKIRYAREI